jgi:flagellar protein FlaH
MSDRDRVDNAIGGGFPEGSLVLLEGETGTGKSALASRFVYGLCTEGTSVGMVSTEATAREYVEQMHSLSYDVVDPLLDGRLTYFHAPTHRSRPVLDRLLEPGPQWAAKAVVVDGFGALCRADSRLGPLLGGGDEDRAMERVTARLDRALAADRLVVLTVDPASVTDRALRPLRDAAGVYIELQTTVVGQEIRKQGLVRRFAGMRRPVDDTISFSVQQGRGIVVESRTVA